MLDYLILSLMTGISTKIVDLAEDHGLKINKILKILLSITYGLIIGYIITAGVIPGFWFGIIIGLILSGKIDAEGHYIGISSLLLFLSLTGFPVMNFSIIILTAFICVLEEWINDEFVDKKKVKGLVKKVLSVRPLLEITSIILSILYSNIIVFLQLLSFDIGYVLTNYYFRKNKLLNKNSH